MPQLKGSIEKPEPSCYTIEEAQFGINFELSGNKQLFAPYSFLSHVRMSGGEELSFHYTYGLVRVRGHHLCRLYSLLKQQNLGILRRSKPDDPCRNEIEVTDITFEDATIPSLDEN